MAFWHRRNDPAPFLPSSSAGEPKKDDPPPQYVPMDRFNAALEEVKGLNSKLDQFTGVLTGFLGTPHPGPPSRQETATPQEPLIDDISDADYEDAVLKGDGARITKRMSAVAKREAQAVRREYEARFQTLETQGMGILSQVNTEVGQAALSSMPYYQLFKADVDAALGQIPVTQRTPEMRQFIYNSTVGANLDRVKAHDAAESVRITREREQLDPPGRARDADQSPTPSTIFGDDILKPGTTWHGGGALWAHRTPDEWARSRYGVNSIQEAAVYTANVLALDDCPRCFGPILGGKCHCSRKEA